MKAKSDLPDRVVELLQLLHQDKLISGKPKICLDNSGENESLKAQMKTDSSGAIFEFTALGSPQFAGVVERKFATLFARVCSTLNSVCLSQDLGNGLWAEAANMQQMWKIRLLPVLRQHQAGPCTTRKRV
jgi:hypothetical protein